MKAALLVIVLFGLISSVMKDPPSPGIHLEGPAPEILPLPAESETP